MKFKVALLSLGLVLGVPTLAYAQCSGQPAPGRVCGNSAATTGLPSFTTQTLLLDRAFAASQGQILNRSASNWISTATPTLGLNGGTGGSLAFKGATSGTATVSVAAAAGTTNFRLPVGNGTNGFVLVTDGSGNTSWANNAAGGTVQSVGLSLPAIFTVSGSPVTTTGTLTGTLATQSANSIWAGPVSGGASAPAFRALVGADLPNPSASTLGGIQSYTGIASQWIRSISTSGVPASSQPAFTDISGTVAAAQLPNPSPTTLGGIQSLAAVSSRWINQISTSGVPSATQPAFTDISGNLAAGQLPAISNNSVLGNASGGTAVPSALTGSQVLDFLGATQGQVLYRNGSVWVPLSPGTNGQVLTTGGPAANPSWTTVTGTGTVTNVATNNGLTGGPITTTGTLGLASIANGTLLANVSGGSTFPTANTPTSVLDVIGSTQGNVLYRGASNWTALAPGANGQVLTMGASTPAWANAGTVSNVATSGILTGGPITTSGTIAVNATIYPQGRITLNTGVPVLTANTTGNNNIFYTPYVGNLVPIYNGTNFIPTAFAETFQSTTDTTKSPAAVAANSLYDIFCWVDTGPTNRCTRGPAWTNSTTRGYTLTRTNGILLNTSSISNGPAALRGTYVGTIASNASSLIDWSVGGSASGGLIGQLMVWNMYNRVSVSAVVTMVVHIHSPGAFVRRGAAQTTRSISLSDNRKNPLRFQTVAVARSVPLAAQPLGGASP
jgi:hypothetical protein